MNSRAGGRAAAVREPRLREGALFTKHTIAVLGAAFLAAASAFVFSAVGPTDFDAAASGGHAKTRGGGSLYLNASERRTLLLHNEARARRGPRPLCVVPMLTGAVPAPTRGR